MSKPHTSGFNAAFSQVMGWSTVVFGINSASNAVRKCEMVRGEAKYYFTLPDCIVSAMNPKYHSMDQSYYKLILHLCHCSFYAAFTQEPNDRKTEKLSCYRCMLLF